MGSVCKVRCIIISQTLTDSRPNFFAKSCYFVTGIIIYSAYTRLESFILGNKYVNIFDDVKVREENLEFIFVY